MAENMPSKNAAYVSTTYPLSTIFTAKNKELAIFGNTIDEIQEKLIRFFYVYERGGIKGEYGIIDTYFSGKEKALSSETLKNFEQFKDLFNRTSLSVNAVAEKFDHIDQRILDYAKTCKNGEMTTKGFEASIKKMSLTARAGQAALRALATAGNMLAGFVFSIAVQAVDLWTHKVERANEKMKDAVSSYESAKSGLEEINSKLETHQETLNSLLSKDKLTYAEKGQLEELQAITRELQLQQDIAQHKTEDASKEAAQKTIDAYQKQYHYDLSEERVQTMSSPDSAPMVFGKDDVAGNLAAYIREKELWEQTQQQYESQRQLGNDPLWIEENAQYYHEIMEDYAQALRSNLSDLWEKLSGIKDEYIKVDAKRQDTPDLLTSSEQEIIATYESIYDTIKMVYEYTRPNDWNNMEFEKIFHTEGIEKTRKELEEMARAGELTPKMLAGYDNLNRAIQDSGLILKKDQTAAEAFCEQLDALYGPTHYDNVRKQLMHSLGFGDTIDSAGEAQLWNSLSSLGKEELILDAYLRIKDQYGEHPEGWTPQDWLSHIQSDLESRYLELNAQLSVPETIDRLETRLAPALDSLKSAYQSIFTEDGFTLENVGSGMLHSISSSIDSLNAMEDINIPIDPSAFENFARVLTDTASTADDIQNQFRELTETIVRAAGSTEVNADTFDVLAKSLEEMGAANARDVLEEIMLAQQDFDAISKRLGLTMEDVADAAYQESVQMLQQAQAAGLDSQALWKLAVVNGSITDGTIATESNVNALLAEAQAAGLDTAMLTALENVKNGNIKDPTVVRAIMEQARQDIQESMSNLKLDFDLGSGLSTVKSAAQAAGRQAGEACTDAFEKELEDLKDLRDRGTLTEKEYLDNFRRLYRKYYRDKKKYAEQYAKYEHEYLQGMKSLYESALSGITSMLDKQIGAYENQKSTAVDSLEAERDARIEVLETQKEQYEEQISLIDKKIQAKEKIIDGINEEIDAIKNANEQRKREIDLEKSKYELERMMNQRTVLQYSADKGMHYTQDTDGARDARQAVEDAELEIEIAGKEEQIRLVEKEIGLLEERKESIHEQIDLLDVQIVQINKQYDRLIAETESYWDSLIGGMEDYKSRWQELSELEEQARLTSMLEQLGISTNDILSMSEEAFARFRDEYIGILADVYSGSDSMLSALAEATGQNVEGLGSYLEATQGYIDSLGALGEAISPVADAVNAVTNALTGGGGDETEANGGNGTGGLTGAMDSLKNTADDVLGEDDGENPEGNGAGIIGRFGRLETAVTDVTAAIGHNGNDDADTQEDGASKDSLIGSINDLGDTTTNILGEPDGEGVTGRFGQLSEVIGEAEAHAAGISDELDDLNGKTAECTIKVNVEMNGELPGVIASGSSADFESGEYKGSISSPQTEDFSAHPDARMLPSDSSMATRLPLPFVIHNEPEQNAPEDEPDTFRPIRPGDRAYELKKTFKPLLERADDSLEYLSGNAMITHNRLMEKMVREITTANIITNNQNIRPNIRIGDIHITCPGVTSREVTAQVGAELNRLFNGFHLYTEQQCTIR